MEKSDIPLNASVHIDANDESFIISGYVEIIRSQKRAKSNFESYGAIFEEEDVIKIPYSTNENQTDYGSQEDQYEAIIKLLHKFDISFTKSVNTISLISDLDREHENFKKFSLKARDIRNNEHSFEDFEEFKKVTKEQLVRQPYNLQLLSSYHLAFAQNACNFSVPGTGKTGIVYGAYAYLKSLPRENPKHINRLFVICPLAAFDPWKIEYKQIFGKEPSVVEMVGMSSKDRDGFYYSDSFNELTLISYQSVSNDIESFTNFLKREENKVMVVLDEAHRIKNINGGKWAEAVLSIAKYANSRVVLTGTPAPNGYQDLHNLFKFIWPDKDIIGFPLHYLERISERRTPQAQRDVGELINNLSPFFLRIKKSDFIDFPEAIYNEPICVNMSPTQRSIYRHIEAKYIEYLEDRDSSEGFSKKLKSARLIRLQQCVTNPHLLERPLEEYMAQGEILNNETIDDREIMSLIKSYNPTEEIPPKFVEVLKLLEKINKNEGADGKVVIWTIFIQNIHDLKQYLNSHGIECALLYGTTPTEANELDILTRGEIIKQFHESDCPYKVIIANPFAVGESISLHMACHNAIYLEKNFNASMYMQSKDRIHRYGLDKNDQINYYYLISNDSIDQTIHDRVLEKEARMLEIIESEEIPLFSMNMDESEEHNDDDIIAIRQDYYDRRAS